MGKPGLVRLLQAPFLLLGALLATIALAIRIVGRIFGWLAWPFVKLGMIVGALGSLYLVLAGEDEVKDRARSFGDALGRLRERCPGSGLWAINWSPRRFRSAEPEKPFGPDDVATYAPEPPPRGGGWETEV